mmetsp:Transcript_6613/g.16792  ORF Transcript_6613/g.16792 Transcript_6613/m.16792 type:complete len:150 (+) Transcript_6613:15-464(+)
MRAGVCATVALLLSSAAASGPLGVIRVVGRPVLQVGTAYRTALRTRPFVTNVATMGTLFAGSDMLAQTAIEKKTICKVDRRRLRNAAVVGSIYSGMCVPQVYKAVEALGSAMVKGAQQGKRATVLKAVMNTGALCFFGNVSNMGQCLAV